MEHKIFILLFFLTIALNVVDVLLTKAILKLGGRELNPVIEKLGMIPVKIGGLILVGLAGYFIHYAILIPANIVFLGVCVWNYRIFIRMK